VGIELHRRAVRHPVRRMGTQSGDGLVLARRA
jgi:hypothetical protein